MSILGNLTTALGDWEGLGLPGGRQAIPTADYAGPTDGGNPLVLAVQFVLAGLSERGIPVSSENITALEHYITAHYAAEMSLHAMPYEKLRRVEELLMQAAGDGQDFNAVLHTGMRTSPTAEYMMQHGVLGAPPAALPTPISDPRSGAAPQPVLAGSAVDAGAAQPEGDEPGRWAALLPAVATALHAVRAHRPLAFAGAVTALVGGVLLYRSAEPAAQSSAQPAVPLAEKTETPPAESGHWLRRVDGAALAVGGAALALDTLLPAQHSLLQRMADGLRK